ncbi:TMEM175 family protein [uncultured Sphingomonas sp.]|uniref:TMEM175 family protein n=1 Tax=uncultured Sphingomonas sp. TaxID=158754 RepID=UPI0026142485|nr:TMEM175 family protein [uncultured Sphingomonas sp.]
MAQDEAGEGQGVGRVEAFSDGVIAIIITIMVLELKVPAADGIRNILAMWHLFLAYALSYIYVGLYWGNHHRLLGHARTVGNALIWSNLALLFGLSLVPFGTAYLGEHEFSRTATQVYLVTLILPAVGYAWLQRVIAKTGARHEAARDYHLRTTRKGYFAVVVYTLGFALTFVSPWLGIACAALVALFWIVPHTPFDRLFARRG